MTISKDRATCAVNVARALAKLVRDGQTILLLQELGLAGLGVPQILARVG